MNILAIGAHADDIELGCGGTLIKHVMNGDTVHLLTLTDSAYSAPDGMPVRLAEEARTEAEKSAAIIGARLTILSYKSFAIPCADETVSAILSYIQVHNIDTVYSHWVHDIHLDHVQTGRAALMAGRHVPRFMMYRSNYYTSTQQFSGNLYSDISATFKRKFEAIRCFETELKRVNYSWIDFFTHQNSSDGQIIGVKYAEAFEVVRYLI